MSEEERSIDMKFRINYEKEGYEDSIVIEGSTIEDCIAKTREETAKRGWDDDSCWSEEL